MGIYGESMSIIEESSAGSPFANKLKNLKAKMKRRHKKYLKEESDIDDILDDEEDEFEYEE